MKLLSMRIDDFLLDLVQQEAKRKKSTKVEVIRAALINFFIHREDIQDIKLAESRLHEKDLSFVDHF